MNPTLTKLTKYHPNQPITYKDLYKAKPGDCFNLFEAVEDSVDNWMVSISPAQVMVNDGNYVEISCIPTMDNIQMDSNRFHTIGSGGITFFDENHDTERIVGDDSFSGHIIWLERCPTPYFKYELPPENALTLGEILALEPGTEVKIRKYNQFNTSTSLYAVSETSVPNKKAVLFSLDQRPSIFRFFSESKDALPTKVLFSYPTIGDFLVIFPKN